MSCLSAFRLRRRDAAVNRRFVRDDGRFLVTRHPALRPNFYNVLLDWVRDEMPEVRARFELRLVPCRIRDYSPYALHVPWMQDPVEAWSPRAYRHAVALAADLAARGIPTINPVDRLTNATKSNGSRLLAAAGIRTPRTLPIDDLGAFRETLLGLTPPLVVREDRGHAGADAIDAGEVVRCETADEARALDLGRFRHPIAMEFVETRDPQDGIYRKYRWFAAGDVGLPHHLQAKEHWFVKGEGQLYTDAIRDEDAAYLAGPDPHEETLMRARRALGLDVVAFDYSRTPDGGIVVWEANPFPYLHFIGGRREYRRPAVERAMAALVRLYHERAGLPVPARAEEVLAGGAR